MSTWLFVACLLWLIAFSAGAGAFCMLLVQTNQPADSLGPEGHMGGGDAKSPPPAPPISTYRRPVVVISDEDMARVRSLVVSGHLAEAQQLVLKELNREFGD